MKAVKIFLRTKKGWSRPVENESPKKCDFDGAALHVGPGDQVYCDLEHDMKFLQQPINRLSNEGS